MENNNLQASREHRQRAQAIQSGSTRKMVEQMTEFRGYKSAINDNRELSEEGKRNYGDKLRADYEVKTMQLSQNVHDDYHGALDESAKCARAVLTAPLPKVNETDRTLYLQKANDYLAQALFATTPKVAVEALRVVDESTTHPSLAAEIKSQVFSTAQHIITSCVNSSEQLDMKKQLGRIFQSISDKAMPEGAMEAREILNSVKIHVPSSDFLQFSMSFVSGNLAVSSALCEHSARLLQTYSELILP